LLHRADIARRLYGPNMDEDWQSGDFEYRMRDRPWFRKARAQRNLKESWQLADDEARTLFAGRLRVVALPLSESPLAIWGRIQQECPNSQGVPEAIYQRGLYFQNRRQFSQASGEYRRLIARFPKHPRAAIAEKQIALIEHADVLLGNTGVYVSGSKPKLWFGCRNTDKVEFVARRFDFKGYLENRLKEGSWYQVAYFDRAPFFSNEERNKESARIRAKFTGSEVARWTEPAPRTERVATHTTRAPLSQIGTYVVEARVPGGKDPSSALVVVSDAAIVQKSLPGKLLLWTVNSRTGRPLSGQKVEQYERVWLDKERESSRKSIRSSDERGVIELVGRRDRHAIALLVTEKEGIAVCGLREADRESELAGEKRTVYGVTDRPIYRPGSTVQFRIWVRKLVDRQYRPAEAGIKLRINVHRGFTNEQPMRLERTTDESGSVTGSVQLSREVPLGTYYVNVDGYGEFRQNAACEFTVEEYKKPEFEVVVKPPRTPPRLGDAFAARVTARYYFGAPVAGAQLRYEVIRRPYRMRYAMPREWDWLYGNGFGDYEYAYPWFDGGDMQEEGTEEVPDERPEKMEVTVVSGKMQLNADGSAEIRVNTDKDPRDTDQKYEIHVWVRDQSRRTIEARGTIVAVRQPCYAFVELDGGWYQPGSQGAVDISTRSVQDAPVDVEGTLTLYRVGWTGVVAEKARESSSNVEQKSIGTWPVRTGGGHLRFPFRAGDEGQFRWVFEARDARQQPLLATVNFWVHGPKFDASRFRMGSLEIIPDRRWYQPGDTARVLVHTAQPDARLLMCDCFDHYWFVDVPAGARVVEIPVLEKHVPNYFLEATLVAGGEAHTEKCELFVPPVRDVVNIELHPDRLTYLPGQKGRVRIHAFDASGKPVTGSMTLTAYDKALTYFEAEEREGPKALLRARIAHFWSSEVTTTMGSRQFGALGTFVCPEYHLEDAAKPPTGAMGGSPGVPSDPSEDRKRDVAARRRNQEKENDESSRRPPLPEIRHNFSDTAAWLPNLTLDQNGTADAEIVYPDSTTTWRIRGYLVTKETHAGDGASEATTTKPFLVRLQAPRFAVERDEVTLSAIVRSELMLDKNVSAELIVPGALFDTLAKSPQPIAPDKGGNLHLTAHAAIGPHAEHRFDWPLRARKDGLAAVTVRALCDEAGDAMRVELPLLPRGTPESVSHVGVATAENMEPQSFSFELPSEIDPSKTHIDVTAAPSACGSIFDAVPFLAGYPYGCVEQTMSRFYPTVIAVDTLRILGVDLKTLAQPASQAHRPRHDSRAGSPVLDPAELQRMTQAGLQRLDKFQHEDGGWGWWEHDESTPYMTAYVLLGLDAAAGAGVKIDDSSYKNGVAYLYKSLRASAGQKSGTGNREERALICYVMSLPRSQAAEKSDEDTFFAEKYAHTLAKAYEATERAKLNDYGRVLLALSLHHRHEQKKAEAVLGEILSAVKVDKTRGLAWLPTSRFGGMRWYNCDIEANAWLLRALVAVDPKNPLAEQIANWLAANRSHGWYWRSTRDTAQAVHALAEYMQIAKEDTAEFTLGVDLDGRPVADAHVGWKKPLNTTGRVVLDGKDLKPGRHRVTLTKKQRGPLYYSITANYFDRSERTAQNGHGIYVERHYFRRSQPTAATAGAQSQAVRLGVLGRAPLTDDDTVNIGETLEVELTISSDGDYDYVAFEDPKPAGFEPVELHSGYAWGNGLCGNVELRDEKIVFFSQRVDRGRHTLNYQLRAETPGSFHARPTHAFDMYNPEIQAYSRSTRLNVRD
jgi:alpha-2-macroglobulin